ncbi:iron-sulfur cluster assembly protein [Gynurincola endophyticus]|jgi:FeS assembly SUF system protein|uniref:iron-sulfur cluster assembly protein n=1 Tax=Gynurincola endophyticus TaxID=2479004 RepID=UPI000F8D7A78|nr:iron-sulfur cluster assembly protein [Gynurincola endophyticus]
MSIDKTLIEEKIYEQLHTVNDPEIPVDIVELGLIYGVEINDAGYVSITMTLTAPACPVAGEIVLEVDRKVREVEGVTDVNVMLTFSPAWTKDRMSEVAKLELGFL